MATRSSARHDSRRGLEELLLLSGRGDAEAFAGVYDELAPRVYGLATRLVGDAAAAEAVTVEAFVEAWRRARHSDDSCKVTQARFVFVAVGDDRKPRPVPPLTA